MRTLGTVVLALIALSTHAAAGPGPDCGPQPPGPERRAVSEDVLARVPLSFVENCGQEDPSVRFTARAGGRTFFFCDGAVVVASPGGRSFRVRLQADVRPIGGAPQQARFNSFKGNDPSRWVANAPAWGEVRYEAVLPGVDLLFRGDMRRVKYEFALAPGADPAAIRLVYEGVDAAEPRDDGTLAIRLGEETLVEERPVAWQAAGAWSMPVEASWRVGREGASWTVGFETGDVDPSLPLVIDPVLSYSTYLGGGANEWLYGVALDAAGNVYVCGESQSTSFPTTAGAYDTTSTGDWDAVIYKLSPTGATLIYSTYIGGTGEDAVLGVTLDASGNACAGGWTIADDFPTVNPIQAARAGGWDCCLVKLDATGSALLFSSYLGGTLDDWVNDMTLDTGGNWYLTGSTRSTDYPTLNAVQPTLGGGYDIFLTKVNRSMTALVYSTYLGGSQSDWGWWRCVAVDAAGSAVVTGYTTSTDFPVANALQPANAGGWDGVVLRLSPSGTSLVFSTYLGGLNTDYLYACALDAAGEIVLVGQTLSTDFPVVNALQGSLNGSAYDGFVAKLDASGQTIRFSTYLGGSQYEYLGDVQLDRYGNIWVTGGTQSTDYPTRFPSQATFAGGYDAVATKLDARGTRVLASTYLGGSGTDWGEWIAAGSAGDAWVLGETDSTDFPTASPLQATNAGGYDHFVAHLTPSAAELGSEVVIGTDKYTAAGGYAEVRRDGLSSYAHERWLRFDRPLYNGLNGETHPACADVDGDGFDEVVLGYGTYTPDGGWIAVHDDRAAGYALLRWVLIPWRAYDRANGCVWPAGADLDGDGTDEIVAGLGTYPAAGGYIYVFEGAAKNYAVRRTVRVPWTAYNAANGEARIACADVDGDRRDEIVFGCGTYKTAGGYWGVFEDETTKNAFSAWRRMTWTAYDAADGQLWPASGDTDGDGRAEVIMGTGPYRSAGGYAQVFDDRAAGYASSRWLRVGWTAYNSAVGATRPACVDLDGDRRAEVVLGLNPYPNSGYAQVLDDATAGYAPLTWLRLPFPAYNASVGGTRVAGGNLGD